MLRKNNPGITDMQIADTMRQEEYNEVLKAVQSGLNPTSHIMALALEIGFTPKGEKKEDAAPKKKPNIKKLKRNQKKSASLIGGSSAGESNTGVTAEQILYGAIDDVDKMDAKAIEKAIERAAVK